MEASLVSLTNTWTHTNFFKVLKCRNCLSQQPHPHSAAQGYELKQLSMTKSQFYCLDVIGFQYFFRCIWTLNCFLLLSADKIAHLQISRALETLLLCICICGSYLNILFSLEANANTFFSLVFLEFTTYSFMYLHFSRDN